MEERLSNIILNEINDADRFELRLSFFRFKLGISALSPRQIVRISREISKCRDIVDEGQTVFQAMTENADNIKYVCNSIAIATRFPFKRLLSYYLQRIPLDHIKTLITIVIKNSDAEAFFFIMQSVKNLNVMKKKT